MSSDELTLFSYEVLGLVGSRGAGPHDLLRMARGTRILQWAGESRYYVEPKRLAKLGYLAAEKAPGRTRERTVYRITDKGMEALRVYARTPVTIQPVKSDALIRLLIADLVGEPATRAALETLREDVAGLETQLEDLAARWEGLPHRAKYLELVEEHLRGMLALHLELVERAEQALDQG